jgi:hypothetical protein
MTCVLKVSRDLKVKRSADTTFPHAFLALIARGIIIFKPQFFNSFSPEMSSVLML